MALPTRVRYGLRLLVRLAIQGPEQRSSMAEIAMEESISVKYLEQIVGMLKPLGILAAIRGARGGYILAKDPEDITLESIFSCLGGLDGPVPCVCGTACERMDICTTRPFWEELDDCVRNFLRGRTLKDLADKAPPQPDGVIAGLRAC